MLTLPKNIICGYFDCSEFGNLSVSPKRCVTKYEIEFYLEDGHTTTTDDHTYKIKKNHIQIAKPGQTRHTVLPFKTAFLKFDVQGEIAEKLDNASEYFCSNQPQKIYNMLEEIILLKGTDNSLLFCAKLLFLLNLILDDSKISLSQSKKIYKTITEAKEYIELNYDKPIKLKDISESVHFSPIYFHNIFSKATGYSPHQYLINCRIEAAKKLLWNSEISICEVAEKSGFGCQQYLNKVFKKETGFSPALYRKSCRENYIL